MAVIRMDPAKLSSIECNKDFQLFWMAFRKVVNDVVSIIKTMIGKTIVIIRNSTRKAMIISFVGDLISWTPGL